MKRSLFAWYALAAVVVLGPVGLRMCCWPTHQAQVINVTDAEEGRKLFVHEWTANDPLTPDGDGLGPVFNAASCVACHSQGGVGGSGGLEHNVTSFIAQPNGVGEIRQGVVHANATEPRFQETVGDIDPSLPRIAVPTLASLLPNGIKGQEHVARLPIPQGVHISQRNPPALFGARLIDEIPDRVIIAQERAQKLRWGAADGEKTPVGRAFIHKNGRVGKFGWKAQSTSLLDFVEAACANELGLSNPGQQQPAPLGMPNHTGRGTDLTTKQCQQMAAFIASLPQPQQKMPDQPRDVERVAKGLAHFKSTGCVDCHAPNIGSVQGIYSDLLMHRMGQDLEGVGGGYNAPPVQPRSPDSSPADEWRTPPLWGVADSAPYLHDGRAATLEQAIRLHGGQALKSAQSFERLSSGEQAELIAFLKSLKAPG